MIQTIEQATQTRVLIGQNGIVVVTGRTAEGVKLAVSAIRMVEEEAHTSNLTQRIKGLLNVPDTPPQQETRTLITGTSKPEEIESSIDEVEEELEVEGDK
jgi:exosome complex component RRP4